MTSLRDDFSERGAGSGSNNQHNIQIDFYGVSTKIPFGASTESTNRSWREIWTKLHTDFKRIVAAPVGLVASTLEGAERLITGICSVPHAIVNRVGGAHRLADETEGRQQIALEESTEKSPELPAPEHVNDSIIELIGDIRSRGHDVSVSFLSGGQLQISILPPITKPVSQVLIDAEIEKLEAGAPNQTQLTVGQIIKGKIIGMAGDDVVIEVGLKSEGLVNKEEFGDEEVRVGDVVDVLLETLEDESGLIQLSKRKADRQIAWHRITDSTNEGDVVEGTVMRKIKGGLLVDIGVPVFLPASQVDVRRPGDVGEFIGRKIRAQILKIDVERRNIVISRRKLVEDERSAAKKRLLEKINEGDIVKGVVKNIANHGAFVEILPGIDGLLHVSDMSWTKNVTHPNELYKMGDEIRAVVLEVDQEKQRISLGVKQLSEDPWLHLIPEHYKPGMVVRGMVTKVTNFGVFVELEDDLEGLLHISELADHKVDNPLDVVKPNEEVDVKILRVDSSDHKIGLSLKRAQWGGPNHGPTRGGVDAHGAMGTDKISF